MSACEGEWSKGHHSSHGPDCHTGHLPAYAPHHIQPPQSTSQLPAALSICLLHKNSTEHCLLLPIVCCKHQCKHQCQINLAQGRQNFICMVTCMHTNSKPEVLSFTLLYVCVCVCVCVQPGVANVYCAVTQHSRNGATFYLENFPTMTGRTYRCGLLHHQHFHTLHTADTVCTANLLQNCQAIRNHSLHVSYDQ